ncbi:MAG TPA: hypothetical protein VJ949_14155 [Cryomorphaceae bacterium]|nr:hypothetical protein [Cryomorphaceae bacterium]
MSSCESNYEIPENIDAESFIQLEESGFTLKGERFFPVMINYVADFRQIGDTSVLGVHYLYEKPEGYEYFSIDSVKLQRKEHLNLIKEMGFNTIRLCLDRVWQTGDSIAYPAAGDYLYLNEDNDKIFSAIDDFVADATELNLKLMILIPPPVQNEVVKEYTISMLKHFNGNSTVFSYDFNNEPLYDREHSAIPKAEVFNIVSEWKEWMETYAPLQFITIGYSEPIEVFSWDPSILPVDFLSFHTYNPLRVPNEIYWYANYSGKPWMIGETALLADGDEIPYEWQADYMKDCFDRTVACGGIGFGWWGFQEVPLVDYAEEGTGLMTSDGTVYTGDSLLPITAKFKPAVDKIKTLDADEVDANCERKANYFNMLGYSNYVLSGRLEDESGEPIEGGLIRGWNEYYSIGQNTFSDEEGNFKLYSNDRVFHVMISAPGKEKKEYHEKIEYSALEEVALREEDLPNRDLEYQKIDYRNYLRTDSSTGKPIFFDYNPGIFTNAVYGQSMGTIILRPWNDIE